MDFSFTGELKTAKSGNLCKHLNHCIIIYIYTVYIISLHQVFLRSLCSCYLFLCHRTRKVQKMLASRPSESLDLSAVLLDWSIGASHADWSISHRFTLYPMYPIYFVYLCFIPRLWQFHGGCQLGASDFCWAPHTMQHFQDLICSSQASQAVSRGSGELLPL